MLALSALALGGPSLQAHATDVVEAALCCARRNAELNSVSEERLVLETPWELPSLRSKSGGLADVAVRAAARGSRRDASDRVDPAGQGRQEAQLRALGKGGVPTRAVQSAC